MTDVYDGETMAAALENHKRQIRNYRNDFQDTHCRVHFCHKGPYLCPICPAVDAGETIAGDMEWLLAKIKKKYRLEVTRKVKKNNTWTWNITTLPT